MKLKFTLEYAGAPFCGWQLQPGVLTVQAEFERSLSVYAQSLAKQQGTVFEQRIVSTASGRTDSGVRAKGQVVSCSWPKEIEVDLGKLADSLNGISIPELQVKDVTAVDDSFDARHAPHQKLYTYSLLLRRGGEGLYRDRAWHIKRNLDLPAMIEAARMLRGTHDFANFRASDCDANSTTRTLHLSELSRESAELLVYSVAGTGFLKQMIRMIVGALVEVGLGRMTLQGFSHLLRQPREGSIGETAPAQGLCLEWVRYS